MDRKVGTWVIYAALRLKGSFKSIKTKTSFGEVMANGSLQVSEVILNPVIQAAGQKVGICSQIVPLTCKE